MQITIILSTSNTETNWNAFRLANLALKDADNVSVFLIGEGVEYLKSSSNKFDVQKQVELFLAANNGKILACETCMKSRNQGSDKTCPVSGIQDLYTLIRDSDKVITF